VPVSGRNHLDHAVAGDPGARINPEDPRAAQPGAPRLGGTRPDAAGLGSGRGLIDPSERIE
jgi:hypothetical protein